MKIRMSGNSIRLRLSQAEVTRFFEQGEVSDAVHFGATVLTYVLKRGTATEIQASFKENQITVLVPADLGNTWASSEQEVGLEHISRFASNGEGSSLRILIEKDFKCLAERPGEDESDNFPNPNLSC